MRLSVILGLCVVLCGAMVASADTIPGTVTGLNLTASITRTINWTSTGYDRVDVMLTGLTGSAIGFGINVVEGTWTAPTASSFELVSDAAAAAWSSDNGPPDRTWKEWTTNTLAGTPPTAYGQSTAPLSLINFDSIVSGAAIWGRTGSGEHFSSFAGSWYTTATGSYFKPGGVTRIARLYIPTGTWDPLTSALTYNGKMSFSYAGGTVETGTMVFGAVVPEPATAALLLSGLFGLAVYAWRKRK